MIDTKLAPYGALLLRLALGVMFIAHALLKVFVFTIPGTVGFFQSLGYPAAFAYLTIFAELAGGVALIAGIAPRLVALALVPILIGAMLVHLPNGWVFSAEHGGWEYPAFLAVTAVVQFLIGDGAAALLRSEKIVPAFSANTAAARA
ncbi:MAG: DoxX family protein [Rhodobiaceae bacterium]|nr:DoxX family protein [Rhodobiaceae bacterium]MCC0013770.1 DoxX family protein [Rhodobiaceae bacterium]MCC0018606.1 DoxX family protein [Rhodobiaceae bacterium]MCC0062200.1 DoxX family protein [Rhodobiaceae bacterium]